MKAITGYAEVSQIRCGPRHLDIDMKQLHRPKEVVADLRRFLENKRMPFATLPPYSPWTNYFTGLANVAFKGWAYCYADAVDDEVCSWRANEKPKTQRPIKDASQYNEMPEFSIHINNYVVVAGIIDE